jgi:hypothetical protein
VTVGSVRDEISSRTHERASQSQSRSYKYSQLQGDPPARTHMARLCQTSYCFQMDVAPLTTMPGYTNDVNLLLDHLDTEKQKASRQKRRLQREEERKKEEADSYAKFRIKKSHTWKESAEGKEHQREHEEKMKRHEDNIAGIKRHKAWAEEMVVKLDHEIQTRF